MRVSLADTLSNRAREEELLILKKELEESRDDLLRDEEIFAEKVRELKSCRKQLRACQSENTVLQEKVRHYLSQSYRNEVEFTNESKRIGIIDEQEKEKEKERKKEREREKEIAKEREREKAYNKDNEKGRGKERGKERGEESKSEWKREWTSQDDLEVSQVVAAMGKIL